MESSLLQTSETDTWRKPWEKQPPKALFILNSDTIDLIYSQVERRELEKLAHFYADPQTRESVAANPSVLADVEVIFSGWTAPVMNEAFLESAPNLRAVFYGAGSVRSFTTEAFWQRGIILSGAYAANAEPVAHYTVATILLSLKKFWSFAAQARCGVGWGDHTRLIPGTFRTTVGLISLGTIARRVLELLRPFNLHVLVHCPFLSKAEAQKIGVELCSLEDVFLRADVVSMHTPELPETRGMIRGVHFRSMKKDASFINSARGGVIAQEEMLDALEERPDLCAILDVCQPEPPLANSRLLTLPNVVLTPHIAGSHGAECQRLGYYMVEEFKCYLRNEPLKWEINQSLAARLA